MKRFVIVAFVLALIFSTVSMSVCYAASGYQDNVIDQTGDWFATFGKQGMEKDRILAERKAERVKRYAEQEAKKAQKEAEKSGQDMKKKLGF